MVCDRLHAVGEFFFVRVPFSAERTVLMPSVVYLNQIECSVLTRIFQTVCHVRDRLFVDHGVQTGPAAKSGRNGLFVPLAVELGYRLGIGAQKIVGVRLLADDKAL